LAKYNEALKFTEDGEDSEVFFNRGIAYKAKGEIDNAIAEYRRALELVPDYAEAHNNLGNLLKDQKKFDEAILHLESSIKIFPDNPNTHNNLGTVYAMKGEVNKAAVYFAKATRLQPSYIDARQNLGLAYIQQGRLDAAEREFSEALQTTKSIMLREEKRLEAAKLMMDQAKKPGSPLTYEQRNKAAGKLDTAEQASRVANAKYQRSLSLFQNILVRRQSAPKR
jgi:tetratricopeptide (TPR) repeat protein